MKDPGFQLIFIRLIFAASLALTGAVCAQPSDQAPNKKPAARTKPQVIYHLPPSSNYAATLHSQAKSQNNDLSIDSDMPTSLQISRANANAAAAQARQEAATPPPQEQPQVTRPKGPSHRSVRSQSSKAKGPARPHGNKSHKK
jgi:hypothetical protein